MSIYSSTYIYTQFGNFLICEFIRVYEYYYSSTVWNTIRVVYEDVCPARQVQYVNHSLKNPHNASILLLWSHPAFI